MVISKDNGAEYELIPANTYQAVCIGNWDIGYHKSQYGSKPKVVLTFEIDEKMTKGDFAGKRFQISKRYTNSLNEKAVLRKELEGWRGQPFTPEQIKGFDLDNLVGANCLISIAHETKGDRTYANIKGIIRLPKGTPKMTPETPFDPNKPPKFVLKAREQSVNATQASEPVEAHISDDEQIPF